MSHSAFPASARWRVSVVLASLVFFTLTAQAQTVAARLRGAVTDPNGAIVRGAEVTVEQATTGLRFTARTSAAGLYFFPALPGGEYAVTVSAPGFQLFQQAGLHLTVSAVVELDAQLSVGAPNQEININAAHDLETSNGSLSGVIEREAIRNLPLNGRNPLNLIALEPGLIQRTNNGEGSGTHINGSRDRAFDVTIDGVDANEPSVPNPQLNLYRLNTDNVQEYRVTAHNAAAEGGRGSGAQVSVATRAGTRAYHGTLFEFFRNTVLNANDFFNNASKFDALARGNRLQADRFVRPDVKLNQYGFELGGPIIKKKTFFFGSYQDQRIVTTQPIATITSIGIPMVYTPQARAGVFRYFVVDPANPFRLGGVLITGNSPQLVEPGTGRLRPEVPLCDAVRRTACVAEYNIFANDPNRSRPGAQVGFDPQIKALLERFPAPNTYTIGDGLNTGGFAWNTPSRTHGPNLLARVDHNFNEHHTAFARWLFSDYDTTDGDLLNGAPQVYPGLPPRSEVRRRAINVALGLRQTLTPNLHNEITLGLARFTFTFTNGESNPDFPGITPLSFNNITNPFSNSPRNERTLTTLQFIDNLSVTRGSHNLRFGLNVRLLRHEDTRSIAGGQSIAPQVTFAANAQPPGAPNGIPNLPTVQLGATAGINPSDNARLLQTLNELLGIPAQIQQVFISDPTSDAFLGAGNLLTSGIRYKRFDSYAQDAWRVSQHLTINYGLRWEVVTPPTEAGGRVYVPSRRPDLFDANNLVRFIRAARWFDRTSWGALAPRVSFAYSFNPRTVVRAGYSLAFDQLSTFQVTAIAGKVPGLVTRDARDAATISSQRIGEGFPLALTPPTRKPSSFYTPAVLPKLNAANTGAFDPDLRLPTVHQWNLSVQRELSAGIVLQAAYVGKRGLRLLRGYNLNQSRTDHDGVVASFLAAKQNLLAGCNPDGTACPAGVTPQAPGVLLLLSDPSFLNSANTRTWLRRNALGNLTSEIDNYVDPSTRRDAQGNPFRADFFRPNPQFAEIFWIDAGGDSYYHALQVTARRRFERGLSLGVAYTFGKSIDDMSVDPVGAVSGGGLATSNSRTPTDIRNWRLDRAVSDFDRTHVLTVHGLYELPFGYLLNGLRGRWEGKLSGRRQRLAGDWSIGGIFTGLTGQPFQVNTSVLSNHDSHVSRADLIGRKPEVKLQEIAGFIGPSILSPDDRAQFDYPAPGTDGTQGRNTLRGLGYINLDASLLKQIALTERIGLQFRAEFFNALNHPNFETPRDASLGNPSITSTNFGRTCCAAASTPSSATIIATGEAPRVVQFALKLSF